MTDTTIDVRIVSLPPMRVASTYGFGEHPEPIAWENMAKLIARTHLMEDGQEHLFFGFNNPNPAPGSPNYGYEQWITVGPDFQPDGETQVKEFQGGLYAVTRAQLVSIGQTWEQLFYWREKSPYRFGNHQWLEACVTYPLDAQGNMVPEEKMIMDLYMPIVE